MKALVVEKYGPTNNLEIKEVEKPTPSDNEILIKIRAAAVNDWDWSMIRGKPFLYRLFMGITRPKFKIPGVDVSGVIEAVGKKAKRFNVGNEVYGDLSDCGFGAFAEYVCVPEDAVAKKPKAMSFEVAASIPHAATLALQGLINLGGIQKGHKILINGAGGGVGTFGLQLAKQYEAEVTGVDSKEKHNMMLKLGFDHVIDYKQEDFTKSGIQYDLILDAKTTRSPFAYAQALKPRSTYVTVGGSMSRMIQILLTGPWIAKVKKKNVRILGLKPNKGLDEINELFHKGKIHSIIDGPYPLEKTPWAIQYFGEAKHQGKIIITI